MEQWTESLWKEQDRHPGDRCRLFSAVRESLDVSNVLYPGSFVDIAPSFVFDSVTYIDSDRRAARFFANAAGVDEIIERHRSPKTPTRWQFIHGDYASDLDVARGEFDLLVSLYAGFVSEHCSQYLRHGGYLLANPSHGDAAMASIDPEFALVGVVNPGAGRYRVTDQTLDQYLQPTRPITVTAEHLHAARRGVAYTKSAFAYIFKKVGPGTKAGVSPPMSHTLPDHASSPAGHADPALEMRDGGSDRQRRACSILAASPASGFNTYTPPDTRSVAYTRRSSPTKQSFI